MLRSCLHVRPADSAEHGIPLSATEEKNGSYTVRRRGKADG
jgi:hypothetical protein